MTTADPTGGVVVRVRLPRALERIRVRDDLAAAAGAPPHVTILFPFMPVAKLRPSVRRDLAAIAAMVPRPAGAECAATKACAPKKPALPPTIAMTARACHLTGSGINEPRKRSSA